MGGGYSWIIVVRNTLKVDRIIKAGDDIKSLLNATFMF